MNIEDYKQEDLNEVFELKRAALHQIENIEKAVWTDDISEFATRVAQLYQTAQRLRVKKNVKTDEANMRLIVQEFQKRGVDISIVNVKKANQRVQR